MQLAKSMAASVTAVTVSSPFHVFAADAVMLTDTEDVYTKECGRQAETFLRFIKTAAEASGLGFEGIHIFHDHPYAAIINTTNKKACDVICTASHGRRVVAGVGLSAPGVHFVINDLRMG